MNKKLETATLAGGCFWCTEAVFKRFKGVVSVLPGYSGGEVDSPSYEQVCSGMTGHAEAAQIKFDPKEISFEKILDVFWHTHDPTTLNRQGNDVGTQYRSVIFYHDTKQKEIAERLREELEKSGDFKESIVTQVIPFTNFYIAEDYHKNYFDLKQDAPYCNFVIGPKIYKLMEKYGPDIKEEFKTK
jgi:peptide-methionine (S)-S-oxide reductase